MSELSPVGNLFFRSGPAAIAGRVGAVVVDAVECHARRRLTHVSKKIQEFIPPFADGYAAASPILEASVFGIEAPLAHGVPAAVDNGVFGGLAVPEVEVATKTSATGRLALLQIASGGLFFSSTIAPNEPITAALKAYDGPATKTQSRDIVESGHEGSFHELLCQVTARRLRGGPLRILADSAIQ